MTTGRRHARASAVRTWPFVAPRARRTPISRRRSSTRYENTPNTPITASSNAMAARPLATAAVVDNLAERYLAAYGPASVADMQAWTGLHDLRDAFEAVRPRLRAFRDPRGKDLFDLPDAPRPPADVVAPARLVPEVDDLIASRAAARFVAAEHRSKVFLSALRIAPTPRSKVRL